jgi:subtilisin family serine protease
MATDKFSADYQEATEGVRRDKTITALVRTKPPKEDRDLVEAAGLMLQREQLATSRADLLGQIRGHYGEGAVFLKNLQPEATSLWLADAVAVSGTRDEIEELAKHEDIVSVDANPTFEVPEVLQTPLEDTPEIVDGSAWGVAKILAPEVWGGLGRGDGVLIGHLDTGVDDTHPALSGKVAVFQEFDSIGNPVASATHDSGVHGTHTAGTMVGRTFDGTNIGVAPKAQLASALVLPNGSGTFAQIVAGMQWAISQGVDVINMSLGGQGYSTLWNLPVLNALFAGVLVVASIGNSGHGTSGGPGNDPFSLGVGATHHLDQAAGFSGGQTLVSVPWFGFQITYTKPDISAPGVAVLSSLPGDELAAFNGTSMAAPHTAAAVALLVSTEPSLKGDPFAIRAILLGAGVEDYGEAGKDQRFGFGRLDALSAAEAAVSLV